MSQLWISHEILESQIGVCSKGSVRTRVQIHDRLVQEFAITSKLFSLIVDTHSETVIAAIKLSRIGAKLGNRESGLRNSTFQL